ncbi:hypothetical protein [Flavobacterium psychrotrophum]|uniref:hypothetical protein n=1 Tax=Flavobacterium psychrotrophum TaxID=2294119 RepID=UPI000E31B16D|nr:hypothetical protein [Flavobacterium psychrotrophum]
MKNFILAALLLFCYAAKAQVENQIPDFNPDTLLKPRKTNPIIFADFLFGGAGGSSKGLMASISANYQFGKNLITARVSNVTNYNVELVSPIVPFPFISVRESIEEYGLLYGRRIAEGNMAFSYSAGVSFNQRELPVFNTTTNRYHYNATKHVGLPFEVSVKWFKPRKIPYHIYYLIPVGPPTGLGHSFGFKLMGNISTTTFVGAGITWGWGWHKKYYD